MVNIPFLGALAGCSARRSERRVASHTSEEQRRNSPGSAAKNAILAFSASLRRSVLYPVELRADGASNCSELVSAASYPKSL